MKIEPGVVVFFTGEKIRDEMITDWKRRIGLISAPGRYQGRDLVAKFPIGNLSVVLLPVPANRKYLIPLFKITEDSTGWNNIQAISELYKDAIIEAMSKILIRLMNQELIPRELVELLVSE